MHNLPLLASSVVLAITLWVEYKSKGTNPMLKVRGRVRLLEGKGKHPWPSPLKRNDDNNQIMNTFLSSLLVNGEHSHNNDDQ